MGARKVRDTDTFSYSERYIFPVWSEEKLLNFFKMEKSGLNKNTPNIKSSSNMEGKHTCFPEQTRLQIIFIKYTPWTQTGRKNNLNIPLRGQQKYWFYNTFTYHDLQWSELLHVKNKMKIWNILLHPPCPSKNCRLLKGEFNADSLLEQECK